MPILKTTKSVKSPQEEGLNHRSQGYCLNSQLPTSESTTSLHTFLVRLASAVILINLLVVVLTGWALYQSREHFKDRIRIQTQNLSNSLGLSIAHVIEKSDVALHAVVEHAEIHIAKGGIDREELGDFINRLHEHLPELQGMRMTNARGDVEYGTGFTSAPPVNIADRDYFRYARDNPQNSLFISEVVFGRIARTWVINIARRVNNPDGSFAGVAYVAFPTDYFLRHFSTFDVGRSGAITLFDKELRTVTRYPMPERGSTAGKKLIQREFREQFQANPDSGTFTARSLVDNVERTYSYQKVAGYPLYITVGLATGDYLAPWRQETAKALVFVSTFIAATIVSAWLLFRYWKGRMKAQAEVRRYHEHMEELVKERTSELEAYNYTVSHDLRKPLTVISGYCGIIGELYADKLGTDGRDYLQEIENGVNRMGALIDTLLNFSLLTNRELQRTTVNLSDMALEVADSLRAAEPARRVAFRIAAGITANCDRSLLQIVLENLLGNAWKYTSKQKEAVIEFGVRETAGETAYFVRDNGVGFDMKYAEKIFAPFQRLAGAGEYQGHGIGLATVGKIIKRHGGRVWAEGEPGKGAAFFFTL